MDVDVYTFFQAIIFITAMLTLLKTFTEGGMVEGLKAVAGFGANMLNGMIHELGVAASSFI